jgi:hypothetical protein
MKKVLVSIAIIAARSWKLGKFIEKLSNFLGKEILESAAKRKNFKTYRELMLSYVRQTHDSRLDGEFIGSGYFGFAFHFAFVTGLLFPNFLKEAVKHPGIFYLKEVSASAGIAIILTYFMIVGHMGAIAKSAYKKANLSANAEREWDKFLKSKNIKKILFYISFLRIPLGGFPGIIKEGLTYRLDGESPLEVSASGPRLWDRVVSRICTVIALVLVIFSILNPSSKIVLNPIFQWITRIMVPLAFISTLGQYATGRGAYKTYIVDKDLKKETRVETKISKFDLSHIKEALIKRRL